MSKFVHLYVCVCVCVCVSVDHSQTENSWTMVFYMDFDIGLEKIASVI